MALPAIGGQVIEARDLYNLCQPSGGHESGKYLIGTNAYASGATCTCYINSESHVSVPVSVSIDEADGQTPSCNTPTTANLTSSGFQVKTTSNATSLNVSVGGNYTIQY